MAEPDTNVSGPALEQGISEDSLIARYFRPIATDPGAFGLIDDAAVLASDGEDIVINTDAVVAGVHFFADDPPETIARKVLRVNLSDIAAKGARPAGFLLTLAIPAVTDSWLAPFAKALGEDAVAFDCPLFGGDTVSTPGPMMLSVTAFGRISKGRTVRRRGATAGDHVIVSGTIGDAAIGLRLKLAGGEAMSAALDPAQSDYLIDRYHVPQPRVALADVVRDLATASMDVSDGLAGDLAKLCAASGVGADIKTDAVPLSAPVDLLRSKGLVQLDTLLGGGDDYEILCTVAADNVAEFLRRSELAGVPVRDIGVVTPDATIPRFFDGAGQQVLISKPSYSHF